MAEARFANKAAMLDAAAEREPGDALAMSVRELLTYWFARARGYQVVAQIRRDLASRGLTTEPDFGTGHFDSVVRLVRMAPGTVVPDDTGSTYLRVDALRSAMQGVVSVPPDATLSEAMTTMSLRDFSQLAVVAGPRSIKGAVSWESIGRARLVRDVAHVRDAMTQVAPVARDADLLALLPTVADSGFVLVKQQDGTLAGIVTAADVTTEFGSLAEPFFLVGEVERRLRLLIRRGRFTAEELSAVVLEPDRAVTSPDELTLGEVSRLLSTVDSWNRLEWGVDRGRFIEGLDSVREIRNGLMHFSADPPSSEDVALLRSFLTMLRGATD